MVVNASAYKFAALTQLPALRERLRREAHTLGLKGTVLLSPEGINLFVAGIHSHVAAFVEIARAVPGLVDLQPKFSPSSTAPFGRMLVKIKREIITFGVEGIDPARHPAPKLDSAELKRWLDEGRPVTLLDTRNDYEVECGTFRGALRTGIRRFRDFAAAARQLNPALKERPLVMFCTGGIRCEKAGPLLRREGFREVYQLDGGILKYFETCGAAHYDGACFVFDEREGVDAALQPQPRPITADCKAAETANASPAPASAQSETPRESAVSTADQI